MLELILILLIGCFLIYAALKTNNKECPKSEIIYRNVAKTFAQEQLNPVPVSQLFSDMFNSKSIAVEKIGRIITEPSIDELFQLIPALLL